MVEFAPLYRIHTHNTSVLHFPLLIGTVENFPCKHIYSFRAIAHKEIHRVLNCNLYERKLLPSVDFLLEIVDTLDKSLVINYDVGIYDAFSWFRIKLDFSIFL